MEDIKKHKEVVLFACGLMSDPTSLVNHIPQIVRESFLRKMRTGNYPLYLGVMTSLLNSLCYESTNNIEHQILHNGEKDPET